MIDPTTARAQYDKALAVLRDVVNDPDATGGEINRARRAADDLTANFLSSNEADVHALTVLFGEFIGRMEGLLEALEGGNLDEPVKDLTAIIDESKQLLPGAPPAPPPAAPAGAGGPVKSARPGKPPRRGRTKAAAADDVDRERRDPSSPKTTRVEAQDRREIPPKVTAADHIGRKLDAQPDRIDVRDWSYQPTLAPLPPFVDNRAGSPRILDQGREGACTGFAMAAVINHLLRNHKIARFVSPRMLYEMARRYDEWPGEGYEGSSARGCIKGWVAHGVCDLAQWDPDDPTVVAAGLNHFDDVVARDARRTPGGAYFRVMHREVRDVHAAINETGAVYVTLMVHRGWAEPGPATSPVDPSKPRGKKLKVIRRDGNATDGHAVALVGYNHQGFIVQNSWGKSWGDGGFALLPYEDFLLHATDAWVAQLGVPVEMDLWSRDPKTSTAGLQRATQSVPLDTIRPYVVDIGNNGTLSDSGAYWTTPEDLRQLFEERIPDAVKDRGWDKARVLLYLHGGLNEENAVARRIVAFRDKMLGNGVYPVHIMWETGAAESLRNIVTNLFSRDDERAGAFGDFLRNVRDNLVEAKDRSFEFTVAKAGTALWDEMKRNARVASNHNLGVGGMQLIRKFAEQALGNFSAATQAKWELHVVGHSAGSIFTAHAIDHLVSFGGAFKTLQFLAPAVTTDLFKSRILPKVLAGACPHPSLYVLSDTGERDDTVGPYGKSLLYLVSNAFEGRRATPLLGMQRFVSDKGTDTTAFDPVLRDLFGQKIDGLPSLIISGAAPPGEKGEVTGSVARSESHGGFDNDPDTVNSVLFRILGRPPKTPFTAADLSY